jgi:hypothetical protein
MALKNVLISCTSPPCAHSCPYGILPAALQPQQGIVIGTVTLTPQLLAQLTCLPAGPKVAPRHYTCSTPPSIARNLQPKLRPQRASCHAALQAEGSSNPGSQRQVTTQLLYNGRRLIGGLPVGECVEDGATLRATAGLLGGKPVKVLRVSQLTSTVHI